MLKPASTIVFLAIASVFSTDSNFVVDRTNAAELIIELDRTSVAAPCHGMPNRRGGVCTPEQAKVRVKTKGTLVGNVASAFYYVTSCGPIEGSGSEVIWDLGNCAPDNKYVVTVAIGSDRILQDVTASASVEVLSGCDCIFCNCSTLSISAPGKPIRPGESFVLDANVMGGERKIEKFEWSIVGAEVVAGARSPRCFVRTDPKRKNYTIEATFRIDGTDPSCNCQTYESKTIQVGSK